MSVTYSASEEIARKYYNSSDADLFYFHVWGGEDIHVGCYENINTPSIAEASRTTIDTMLDQLEIHQDLKIIDLGSGYGGSARYIVEKYQCSVDCLNISEEQNRRNRDYNKSKNLDTKISVIDGSFEDVPKQSNTYDIVWSQDAILHSSQKEKVFREISRILKLNGEFIFTDPMQNRNTTKEEIIPVLNRLNLDSMGSFDTYEKIGKKFDLILIDKIDLSKNLFYHYSSVKEQILSRYDFLISKSISSEYLDKTINGLNYWIDAANKSLLNWGIMRFKKI